MSDAGECARCHARLHPLAAFCRHCGLIVPRKSQIVMPEGLLRIARRHRSLMGVSGIFLVVHLLFVLAAVSGLFSIEVTAIAWCMLVVVLVLCMLSLSDALRLGVSASVLLVFLGLIPLVNLAVVLWLCRRAIVELHVAGVRVGFLGTKGDDVEVIEYEHRCRSCGYDLRGLTSLRCPECGLGFAPPVMTGIN